MWKQYLAFVREAERKLDTSIALSQAEMATLARLADWARYAAPQNLNRLNRIRERATVVGTRRRMAYVAVWHVNTEVGRVAVCDPRLRTMSLDARLEALAGAVRTARTAMAEQAEREHEERPIYIFAAPEFLFVRSPTEHHLTEVEKERVRARVLVISRENRDVVVIPGTVAWVKTADRPPERQVSRRTGQAKPAQRDLRKYAREYRHNLPAKGPFPRLEEVGQDRFMRDQLGEFADRLAVSDPTLKIARNTAFLAYDGTIHTYHKKFEAIEDGLSMEIMGHEDWRNTFFSPGTRSSTILLDGIRFGLEICADHNFGLLRARGRTTHVEVLSSSYIGVFDDQVGVVPGGHLVHADSKASGIYRERAGAMEPVETVTDDNIPLGELIYGGFPIFH